MQKDKHITDDDRCCRADNVINSAHESSTAEQDGRKPGRGTGEDKTGEATHRLKGH